MNLQERLDAQKSQFVKKAPKETLDIMRRASEQIRESVNRNRMLKIGDPAPDFELDNAFGQSIRLKSLLNEGALILSFYRGKW